MPLFTRNFIIFVTVNYGRNYRKLRIGNYDFERYVW